MYRYPFIILVFLIPTGILAQSFAETDSATWAQYLAGEWKNLTRSGKDALERDMDYYYLRMRLGIAWFELKNYRTAALHFRKAMDFNEDDPVALEYLYYCYLNTGQTARAAVLRNSFTGKAAAKLPKEKPGFIISASAEYLYSTSGNDRYVENAETYFGSLVSGHQVLTRSFHNGSMSLSHTLAPGVVFSHAYSYLDKSNFMYYHDGLTVTTVDDQRVRQHQYYLSPSVTTSTGLTLSPSLHLLSIGYQVIASGGNGFGPGSGVVLADDRTFDIIGGLAVTQVAGPFNLVLGGNYSNLNETGRVHFRGGATWHPLGNLDLYLGGYLNGVAPGGTDAGSTALIPEYLLGAGIAGRVWLEVLGSHGEMRDYTEGNGYIVYNGLDEMRHKISMNLVIPVSEKGSRIYLGGRWVRYLSEFIPSPDATVVDTNPLEYDNFSFFGGILLTF